MDMIVAETGYQKGGIYKHFSSKMDLAQAAFQYNYEKIHKGYLMKVGESEGPRNQLVAFIKNYQHFIRNAPVDGGCPILNTAIESDDSHRELRHLSRAALDEWIDALSHVIENGQDLGEFNNQDDPRGVAEFFIATIEGAVMMGKLKRDGALMKKIGDRLLSYIEKVLVP